MKSTLSKRMISLFVILLLFSCLPVSSLTITVERRDAGGDARTLGSSSGTSAGKTASTLFLLTGYKSNSRGGSKVPPKAAEMKDDDDPAAMAELPPKPLPQRMFPRNSTENPLKPPLSGAQVAPPLVDNGEVCRYECSVRQLFLLKSNFTCESEFQKNFIKCLVFCQANLKENKKYYKGSKITTE